MIERFNRLDAKSRGDRYFWPDVPCVDGHQAHRFVANGLCLECWFQVMHGRSHTADDLAKGVAEADAKRNRRAFVKPRDRRVGVNLSPKLESGTLEAARKAASKRLWQNARNRARGRGIKFNVRASEFLLPQQCPVLGTTLTYHSAATRPNSDACAVLERVDPARGYEPGNVTVMSARASRLRSDATIMELVRIAHFYGHVPV